MRKESSKCRILCSLAFCLLMCGLSATIAQENVGRGSTFSVYRKPTNGPAVCAQGSPESTESVKMLGDCSWRCMDDPECTSFNYREAVAGGGQCEMFVYLPLGFAAADGCQHFRKDGATPPKKSFVLTGWRLYITGDDKIIDMYIDGQPYTNLPNGQTWNVPDLIARPAAPSLIAVSVDNWWNGGGLLASDSDGRITDSNWKCTTNLETGWTQSGFDDSVWPAAVQQAVNGEKGTSWNGWNGGYPIPNVRPQAYWIWATGAGNVATVYCRWRIPPKVTPAYQLSLTADNYVDEVYFDGIQYPTNLAYGRLWNVADTLSWNSIPSLIAVRASTTFWAYGIVASDSTGMISDSSWKCTSYYHNDWMKPTFLAPDLYFSAAKVQNANGDLTSNWCRNNPGHQTASVRQDARWVWANDAGWPGIPSTAYCRISLAPSVSPIYQFNITVDDYLKEVYFDGAQYGISTLPNKDMWNVIDTITLIVKPQLIAIHGQNGLSQTGILFQDSLGHVSDIDWKCSSWWQLNWEKPSFDDSAWPEAVAQWANGDPTSPPVTFNYGQIVEGISPDAVWIWSGSYYDTYCRYHVPP